MPPNIDSKDLTDKHYSHRETRDAATPQKDLTGGSPTVNNQVTKKRHCHSENNISHS